MIWQNPWAWAGLVALAVPILIHLFSRRQARVQPFPTLRFLEGSRLLPTRRTRVSDLLLLLLRLAILGAAVAALAQPLWLTNRRQRAQDATLARAIVVDTSASMSRRVLDGAESALARAQAEATRRADVATTSTIVRSANPSKALAGAVAWLRLQRGRGEVVVISDFQPHTIDSLDLHDIPTEIGIALVPIAVASTNSVSDGAIIVQRPAGDRDLRIRTSHSIGYSNDSANDHTNVEWTAIAPSHDSGARTLDIMAGASEQPRVLAATRAVLSTGGSLRINPRWPVAVVFPEYAERSHLLRDARPLDSLWMVQVVARLRVDRTLVDAASDATITRDTLTGDAFVPLVRTNRGQAVAMATHGVIDGRDALLLFAEVDAGSVAAAALIGAASRAAFVPMSIAEQESSTVPAATLQGWERKASGRAAHVAAGDAEIGDSDARWLWLFVLLLLGAEAWMRRARPDARYAGTAIDAAA